MKSTWWIQHKQQKKLPQAELYPGVCELAWVKQTCYVQIKNSNDNNPPPPQELYFNHHNYVPLPRTAFGGGFCNLSFNVTYVLQGPWLAGRGGQQLLLVAVGTAGGQKDRQARWQPGFGVSCPSFSLPKA